MNIRRVITRLDRLQHARGFKIAATVLVVLLALGGIAAYALIVTAPDAAPIAASSQVDPSPAVDAPQLDAEALAAQQARQRNIDQARRTLETVLGAQRSAVEVSYGIAIAALIAVVVIWLGLGLTYFALLAIAAGVAWPLLQFESTDVYGRLLVGVVALTASFTALMQGLRLLLSPPGPICAIARNVLAEAVRMKISLVFIVLLVLGLAALPGVLNEETPLRYRVQSFLQYAAGGSFWMIALLVLFFSVASLTGEQRDKIIWQTITKPVAPWKYLFGKWLGVSLLAAVLLLVTSSGTFLFVEYLRSQPANGESVAYAPIDGRRAITTDRLILETQVLAARRSVEPTPPFLPTDPQFIQAANERIERERREKPGFQPTRADVQQLIDDLYKSSIAAQREISPVPEDRAVLLFEGLESVRGSDTLVLLRYKIDSGSNSPDETYAVTFVINGVEPRLQRVGPGHPHTLELLPSYVDAQGRLVIEIYNGSFVQTRDGQIQFQPNPKPFSLPDGEVTVSYAAGSYQANFFRATFILWLKLAFLAMLAIWASTFLSFPVACLVAVGAFLAAESAGFLTNALDRFGTSDMKGNLVVWRALVYYIGRPVAQIFQVYADLKPVTRVVDGQLISLGSMARGSGVLAAWSAVLFMVGVLVFRKREMALYSGH